MQARQHSLGPAWERAESNETGNRQRWEGGEGRKRRKNLEMHEDARMRREAVAGKVKWCLHSLTSQF